MPKLSELYKNRRPSNVRLASLEFDKRMDGVVAFNVSIGNVSLPLHPKMQERMKNLMDKDSPFYNGVVDYTATSGTPSAKNAFFKSIQASGFKTEELFCQVTEGGSAAMELVIAGVSSEVDPLLLIEPAYSNYIGFSKRLGHKYISTNRDLLDDGVFSLTEIGEIEEQIKSEHPTALVVIPFDNPTGQLLKYSEFVKLAKLCVKYDMWLVSDEAYRELYYTEIDKLPSIWAITNKEVPGIEGRRISIESTSKVWNGCGLRIGAIITDNKLFHEQAVAEQTSNLSSNSIGQYIFTAVADMSHEEIRAWFSQQRKYYKAITTKLSANFNEVLPEAIVSLPEAAIYSVIDLRKMVPDNFQVLEFALFCAREGKVNLDGTDTTLLFAPMGRTQLRIAYVLDEERMYKVPLLLKHLLDQYLKQN